MDDTTLLEVQPDGAILLPAALREELGIMPGDAVMWERAGGGILIRAIDPASAATGADNGDEEQTAEERQAAALLADAVSEDEYARAVAEVRGMGLDPETVTRSAAGE